MSFQKPQEMSDAFPPTYDNPRLEPTYKLRREWIASQVLGNIIQNSKDCSWNGKKKISEAIAYADILIAAVDQGLTPEEIIQKL